METVHVDVFLFDDLDESAKDVARAWYREGMEYPWFKESTDSIEAFVEHFGATVRDWSIGERGRDYIKTDITPAHFRGLKLKDINPDYMPTGYCLDADLWQSFHSEWKQTGDPMYAFQQALESALCAIADDVDYHYSDESVDEHIKMNEYRFTENGKFFC